METLTKTMTNVQVVQQAFADFGSGNVQGILDACSSDVVWNGGDNPGISFTGIFRGKNEVKQFFMAIAENVDYILFEPKEFFHDKEKNAVTVLGRHKATVKKTGKTYDHDWCMVFRLREAKIFDYVVFVDTREQAECFK